MPAFNNTAVPARPVFLSPQDTGAMLGVATSTLANWRSLGNPDAPPFVKIGGLVRYPLAQLLMWLDARTSNTMGGAA